MPTHTLDLADARILHELQGNARLTNLELASRVHLSASPCLARVRKLENSGLINRYVALLDSAMLGLGVSVFIHIRLERQIEHSLELFEEAMQLYPEVMECYLMSGEYDYLLRVVLADTADFERLHSQHLTRLPNVARVHSSFALRTVQKSRELPVR